MKGVRPEGATAAYDRSARDVNKVFRRIIKYCTCLKIQGKGALSYVIGQRVIIITVRHAK